VLGQGAIVHRLLKLKLLRIFAGFGGDGLVNIGGHELTLSDRQKKLKGITLGMQMGMMKQEARNWRGGLI
jgi:hypothetical protein